MPSDILPTFLLSQFQGFEELLSSTNSVNRKLEEVHGMTREYSTIAALWTTFRQLMRGQSAAEAQDALANEAQGAGLPGTGGFTVSKAS